MKKALFVVFLLVGCGYADPNLALRCTVWGEKCRPTDGRDGKDGSTGPKGDTGVAGSDGATGVTGVTGAVGAAGRDGEDGSDGEDGAVGYPGADGLDGKDGMICRTVREGREVILHCGDDTFAVLREHVKHRPRKRHD